MGRNESEALLKASALVVGYRRRGMLPPVSLQVSPGDWWGVIGRNGAGKTTLVRTLLGLNPAVSGTVERAANLRVAYVPQREQQDDAIPARVIDVVNGGLDAGWSFLQPGRQWGLHHVVEQAMRDTDLFDLQRQAYRELSEGQKQRVLIARALVSHPEVMVLDEPTSAMDREAELSVFRLLQFLRRSRELALVMISHRVELLARYCTHAALVDRDQSLACCGPIEQAVSWPVFRQLYGRVSAEPAPESFGHG